MISLLLDAADIDFDAVGKAVAACDRNVISKTVTDDVTRHGAFLVQAFKDQRAIAADRAALAERRRHLRGGEPTTDTEQGIALEGQAIDDRQRALDDQRQLDRQQQEVMANFRQVYLTRCSGRGAS